MITYSNNSKECDTLVKGAHWAMATERELTALATMLLGRRSVRFKGISSDLRVMTHGWAGKEAFGLGQERGLSDHQGLPKENDDDIPF
jgi:hypothetical protein